MTDMTDAQVNVLRINPVQRGTFVLLLCCHGCICVVAVLSGAALLPVLSVCLLSFLLTLSIPYNLHVLEMMMDRLAAGLSVEPVVTRWRWPLARLFGLVNALAQQRGQQVQVELRNLAYRDQLLQQVGKTAAQEERNRLARDLHDSIKQQLFSIVVNIAAVKARWEQNAPSARKIVDDIERIALETQIEMQALLQQLRPVPLENVGLIESLRMQCQALGYRTGAVVTAELSELPADELLPPGTQETIFRIVQEGFANIARHARAPHVWLSLRQQEDALLVEIGDDGQGFDVEQANERSDRYGGMGLPNVRERVGTLGGSASVWSLPGEGTTLHLCIPLIPAAKPEEQAREQEQTRLELRKQARQQLQQLIVDWIALAIGVALAMFLWNTFPLMQRYMIVASAGLIVLVAWFAVVLLKTARVVRVQRMLHGGRQRDEARKEGEA